MEASLPGQPFHQGILSALKSTSDSGTRSRLLALDTAAAECAHDRCHFLGLLVSDFWQSRWREKSHLVSFDSSSTLTRCLIFITMAS